MNLSRKKSNTVPGFSFLLSIFFFLNKEAAVSCSDPFSFYLVYVGKVEAL